MPFWFSRRPRPSLPPNIHTAATSSPSPSRDSEKLPVNLASVEPVQANKPLFYRAAERLARQAHISPLELLQDYERRLRESNYPGPDCLSPDEVQDYADRGKLTESQNKHLSECSACESLLAGLYPEKTQEAAAVAVLSAAAKAATEEFHTALGATDGGLGARSIHGSIPSHLLRKTAVGVAGAIGLALAFLVLRPILTPKPGKVCKIAVVTIHSSGPGAKDVAYGWTEDLIRKLGSVRELRVTGTNTAMAFENKGAEASPVLQLQIAHELGVDHLAEVSVDRINSGSNDNPNDFQVSAQLINVSTRETSSQSYIFSGNKGNALRDSNKMARGIVRSVGIKLTASEESRFSAAIPLSPSISLEYFRGRYLLWRRTQQDIEKARLMFDEAVTADPDFALGYASLADSYNLLALHGFMPASEAYSRAKENVEKALKLDPRLANAHAALALSDLYDKFDWREAESELKSALQLNPSYAEAHQWYGLVLSALKRPKEAMVQLQDAVDLEPLAPTTNAALGGGYFLDGQTDRAIEIYKSILDKAKAENSYGNRKYDVTKENLVSAYLANRQCKDAQVLLQELPNAQGDLAYSDAVCGQEDVARKLLPTLKPFDRAQVFAALGDVDDAFKALDQAYEERSYHLFQLAVDPALKPLHNDPRFKEQLRRINYPIDLE